MARITPLHLIPALIAAASHAGEITIEQRPFSVGKTFAAAVIPGTDCLLLKLHPEVWADFKILEIATHGARASKGDVLIRFDAEAIDQKIADARKTLATGTLALAQAELDLKLLQQTAPNKLESVRRAAEIAKEENSYFTQTRRKAAEDSAAQSLKRSKQILANQSEELKQLTKMYEADDITENTEEIILVRQQDAVAAAEFALRMEMLDHKRALEVLLPREAKTLADNERDTAISQLKAEADIPRSIELKKIELETLKTTNTREKEILADLESDRTHFEVKAPADGWFYHGPIENGKWTPGEIIKTLIPRGQVPVHRTYASFVSATAKLSLVSFLDVATHRALKPDLNGSATLAGREDLEIPVKLVKLTAAPEPDGTYRADFSVTWPEEITPAIASTAEIHLIAYQKPTAISVPNKALAFDANGWTVEVKLADGKSERRPVKRGLVSKEDTEILSGLEVGQVVLLPDK
jgi:hypothetical protein